MSGKSKQEIESEISKAMKRILKEQLGEDAKIVKTQIAGDTIIVRFKSILPPAERHMTRDQEGAKVMNELKEKLINEVKPLLEAMINKLINSEVIDIHSSFDAETDERIEVFTFDKNLENIYFP